MFRIMNKTCTLCVCVRVSLGASSSSELHHKQVNAALTCSLITMDTDTHRLAATSPN